MFFKYWEIIKGLAPILIKLDAATRTVAFVVVCVFFSSKYLIDYVDAKHLEVNSKIEKEQGVLKENLVDKMDAQHKVIVALMGAMKEDAQRTREGVQETRRNVLQIYKDLSALKKTN